MQDRGLSNSNQRQFLMIWYDDDDDDDDDDHLEPGDDDS